MLSTLAQSISSSLPSSTYPATGPSLSTVIPSVDTLVDRLPAASIALIKTWYIIPLLKERSVIVQVLVSPTSVQFITMLPAPSSTATSYDAIPLWVPGENPVKGSINPDQLTVKVLSEPV